MEIKGIEVHREISEWFHIRERIAEKNIKHFQAEINIDSEEKAKEAFILLLKGVLNMPLDTPQKIINYPYEAFPRVGSYQVKIDKDKWLRYLKSIHDESNLGDYGIEKQKRLLLKEIINYYKEIDNLTITFSEKILGYYYSEDLPNKTHNVDSPEYHFCFNQAVESLEKDGCLKILSFNFDVDAKLSVASEDFEWGVSYYVYPASHCNYKVILNEDFVKRYLESIDTKLEYDTISGKGSYKNKGFILKNHTAHFKAFPLLIEKGYIEKELLAEIIGKNLVEKNYSSNFAYELRKKTLISKKHLFTNNGNIHLSREILSEKLLNSKTSSDNELPF